MVPQEATEVQHRDAHGGNEASVPQANRNGYLAMSRIIAVSILAWVALWLWGRSPYSRFLSHHSLDTVRGDVRLLVVFIAGWVVMVIAMMLPTTLSLLTSFERLNSQRANTGRLGILLIVGYLMPWTLFGITIYAGDWLLHQIIHRSHWLSGWLWILPALTLIVAGTYQLTPLKQTCLDACRTPQHCLRECWDENNQARRSLLVGLHHGRYCVGCCWALMLLMFASGASNLGSMVVLGSVMLAERQRAWGRRLVIPLGVTLVAWGCVVLLSIPPSVSHLHHH